MNSEDERVSSARAANPPVNPADITFNYLPSALNIFNNAQIEVQYDPCSSITDLALMPSHRWRHRSPSEAHWRVGNRSTTLNVRTPRSTTCIPSMINYRGDPVACLDEQHERGLTLISVPAGHGKTTLL